MQAVGGMATDYDVVIVGAGPAGLCAAHSIRNQDSRARILIVDRGAKFDVRDRNAPDDLIMGVGGAGLFSDGKFSFFPSASGLWTSLSNTDDLKSSYEEICKLLSPYLGDSAPAFPDSAASSAGSNSTASGKIIKEYPSQYVSFGAVLMPPMATQREIPLLTSVFIEKRKSLLHILVEAPTSIATGQTVSSIQFDDANQRFIISLSAAAEGSSGEATHLITAKRLVLSNGRMGPSDAIIRSLNLPTAFKRLEYGIRIVLPASNPFFHRKAIKNLKDPKIVINGAEEGLQWRTFCCCRNGEVVTTRFDNIVSYSGRADGIATGFSNFGFNTRITNANAANEVIPTIADLPAPFELILSELLEGKVNLPFSTLASQWMLQGLQKLVHEYPEISEATVVGPTIEGVGEYVKTDGKLMVKSDNTSKPLPVWVCGDSSGIFRGIVAAMVSGAYVGRQIIRADHPETPV